MLVVYSIHSLVGMRIKGFWEHVFLFLQEVLLQDVPAETELLVWKSEIKDKGEIFRW